MYNLIVGFVDGVASADRLLEHTDDAVRQHVAPSGAVDVSRLVSLPTLVMPELQDPRSPQVARVGDVADLALVGRDYRSHQTCRMPPGTTGSGEGLGRSPASPPHRGGRTPRPRPGTTIPRGSTATTTCSIVTQPARCAHAFSSACGYLRNGGGCYQTGPARRAWQGPELEEPEELLVAVAAVVLGDHRAAGQIEAHPGLSSVKLRRCWTLTRIAEVDRAGFTVDCALARLELLLHQIG
jgi:hypothetical protein